MSVQQGIQKIRIRPVTMGAITTKFKIYQNFVVPRNFFINKYNKNKSLDPLKMFCAPSNL